jgi:hypothetical protein
MYICCVLVGAIKDFSFNYKYVAIRTLARRILAHSVQGEHIVVPTIHISYLLTFGHKHICLKMCNLGTSTQIYEFIILPLNQLQISCFSKYF